jgi:EAL domain-containing protein (putative c-di-GMP-specific phosphodiesterase class I)
MTSLSRPGTSASHGSASRAGHTLTQDLDRARRTRELVEDLIGEPARLGPDLQPVRRLDGSRGADGEVVAWKATGRGQAGTELADTLDLLAGAASLGLVERLDWAFRVHVLETVQAAGLREPVHLTPEPETFCGVCPPRLAVAFGRGRRERQVGAEVHADAFADPSRLARALDEYRGWGWQVVLADVGDELAADPAVHASARRSRPDVVQVDVSRPQRDSSPGRAALLALADEVGAELMAVNVHTSAHLTAASALGATTGRGLLLGAPRSDLPGAAEAPR